MGIVEDFKASAIALAESDSQPSLRTTLNAAAITSSVENFEGGAMALLHIPLFACYY